MATGTRHRASRLQRRQKCSTRLLMYSSDLTDRVRGRQRGFSIEEARMSRTLDQQGETLASNSNWVIEQGSLSIDCRDEGDAKAMVRRLRQRGRLVARTAFGVSPGRRIEGADVTSWLAE
jgi:hypothetical protein